MTPDPLGRSRRRSPLAFFAPCLLRAGCISSHPPPVNESGKPGVATPAASYAAGTGPSPALPPPEASMLPVVEIAPAVGWAGNDAPRPANGFAVTAFARGLDHPRTLLVLPNGDVLVAEPNRPEPTRPPEGLRPRAMAAVQKRAGAGVPSADRITLLRDGDGDGVAEQQHAFLTGLHSPFGMALAGDTLYVANADALVAAPYRAGATTISATPRKVADLPAGRNHHWTKSLVASADGRRLYVGVGSNSNIAEHGMDEEVDRAAVLEVDPATGSVRNYASGLRNPTALAIHPHDRTLWAVVNERDEIGNDLVPDYLTAVREGAFYGWPWSYFGQHVDARVQPQDPVQVARAIAPDYALGSHVAPLGLAFQSGGGMPPRYREGAFIGLHGSWNRQPKVGYRVVFVPFVDGRPAGPIEPVLEGFVNEGGDAQGRPVGVAVDRRGGVLVADDVGNAVWRVTATGAP
ncbi:PQQ-dependent sugar dehydrogenase [Pseudoxanthomonas daejeonensis]|uniref:Sorbosone dehydrogenase n=1 Tax=Pseudoxanthomonas daejeonensis TaxID=266062 RepID=A0ABQ6ZBA6_9GAMM|nr:sorbosone dehydrogenase [Pseudoxanthomonas daejeonensis]